MNVSNRINGVLFFKFEVLLVSAAMLSFGADCLLAQSYMTKIPVDGSWAKYTERHELNRDTDKAESWELEVTIRCVGTSYDEMETLRWVEIEFIYQSGTGKYERKVFKMLIPEEHLGPGKDPVNHIRKLWYCHETEPDVLNPGELDVKTRYSLQTELRHFLTPPLKDKQSMENKTIELANQSFDCDVVTGNYEVRHDEKGNEISQNQVTLYSHSSSPFGLVRSENKIVHKMYKNNPDGILRYKSVVTRVLKEFGKNAESVLPDCK